MTVTVMGRPSPAQAFATYFDAAVPAGFPSPAADYEEMCLSIDELVGLRAPHTYLVRVAGDSMVGRGIHDGDILVVDRAIEPRPGYVVVAYVLGEMTVKTLGTAPDGRALLEAANPAYRPIAVPEGELQVWGVVTCNLHFQQP